MGEGEEEVKRKIKELSALIGVLEKKANITEEVKHARTSGSPDKFRDAYYSVDDLELRKRLITTTGELDQLYLQQCELAVASATEELARATDKSKQQPWPLAIAAYVGPMVVGQWGFGLFGAVGGAVGGYFLGQWVISATKKEDAQAVAQAQKILAAAQRRNEASKVEPYLFSAAEQAGGEREK
ncbi:hypothetical protein [Sideroxydans lithotrophicus]|uniref:Uncharacterized protein n=1 Tax=Sideroxydans lithotrophicus (strain ES-1) TaxID=580332 RepID=D5CS65_SIDLE|nr:hypothetical protein [Sideroxydans lithotrophicus]ADE11801.1 hypothetical protein Slit_1568 [Sideroxydans lithotrophicus ES-1]